MGDPVATDSGLPLSRVVQALGAAVIFLLVRRGGASALDLSERGGFAIISFVCSVGNVPLAAVLWNGGISFGEVVAFIFADLIVLPVLNIYRKYYGVKMAGFLLFAFYIAMAGASLIVDVLFGLVGLIQKERNARLDEATISSAYTIWLNIVFLGLAAALVWRFCALPSVDHEATPSEKSDPGLRPSTPLGKDSRG
jgi:uncharacterized membrane protein YraQ (UPF0718 family)